MGTVRLGKTKVPSLRYQKTEGGGVKKDAAAGPASSLIALEISSSTARRGSAHRGASGVAMPTDEDDQDGHFFYNHPERGAYSAA